MTNPRLNKVKGKQILKKFTVSRNHESQETDNINSVQSSLKSHPLWITLYLDLKVFNVGAVFITG